MKYAIYEQDGKKEQVAARRKSRLQGTKVMERYSKYAAPDKIHNIQGKQAVQVQITKVLKDFDRMLNEKKIEDAQNLLNSMDLRNGKTESSIDLKQKEMRRNRSMPKEALREDDDWSRGRNLATILVKQGYACGLPSPRRLTMQTLKT